MRHPRAVHLFTALCLAGFGAFSLLFQGCAGANSPSSPAQATTLAPTPTPASDVTFSIANSAGNIAVWQIAVTSNASGLTNYTSCTVPAGSVVPVTAPLPSGSGSYQVTIYCNAGGYCRKAVCGPVNLTLGGTSNVSISSTGAVTVDTASCPSLGGC